MSKGVNFQVSVKSGAAHSLQDREKQCMVNVVDARTRFVGLWSAAKFTNRRFLMQELYEKWVTGVDAAVEQTDVRSERRF